MAWLSSLFCTGVDGDGNDIHRPYIFSAGKRQRLMRSEILISKAQYLLEMEHRWRVAERMMGEHYKVGWVSRSVLAQATNDLSMISDDCEPGDVPDASAILRTK